MLSIGLYKAPLVSWAHYATLLAAGPVLARAWSTSPKPDTATEQIHRSPGLPLGRPAMLPSWGLKSTALPPAGRELVMRFRPRVLVTRFRPRGGRTRL